MDEERSDVKENRERAGSFFGHQTHTRGGATQAKDGRMRAQKKKNRGVVQTAGPFSPGSTSQSPSTNGGNQSSDQASARCSPAGAQPHSE